MAAAIMFPCGKPRPTRPGRILFLLILVLAATATTWYFWPLLAPFFSFLAAPTTDLDLVPRDARAFVTLRLADLWQGPLQPVQRQLGLLEEDVQQTLGLAPTDIERLMIVWPEGTEKIISWPDPAAWLLVTTAKPNLQAQVQARLAPNTAPVYCQDKPFFPLVNHRDKALFFINNRLFYLGPTAAIKDQLAVSKPSRLEGPLQTALQLAADNSAAGYMRIFSDGTQSCVWGPFLSELPFSQEVKDVSWTWNEKDSLNIALRLSFADAAQARAAQKAVQAAWPWAKEQISLFFKKHSNGIPGADVLDMPPAALTIDNQNPALVLHWEGKRRSTAQVLTALLPAWHKQRERQARGQALANLGAIVKAMLDYEQANGHFPPAVVGGGLSWRVALLPWLGYEELYKEFKLDQPWDSPSNLKLLEQMPRVFGPQPSTKARLYSTYYQVFSGPDAVFSGSRLVRRTYITDGCEQTLLIVEAGREVLWTQPDELLHQPHHLPPLGAQFPNVFLAAFADGQVRALPRQLNHTSLDAFITPGGKEAVSFPPE